MHARSSTRSREVNTEMVWRLSLSYLLFDFPSSGCFGLGDVALLGTEGWNEASNSGVIGNLGSWGFPEPGLMCGQVAVSRVD